MVIKAVRRIHTMISLIQIIIIVNKVSKRLIDNLLIKLNDKLRLAFYI